MPFLYLCLKRNLSLYVISWPFDGQSIGKRPGRATCSRRAARWPTNPIMGMPNASVTPREGNLRPADRISTDQTNHRCPIIGKRRRSLQQAAPTIPFIGIMQSIKRIMQFISRPCHQFTHESHQFSDNAIGSRFMALITDESNSYHYISDQSIYKWLMLLIIRLM